MQASITSKISAMCNNTLRLMLLTLTVSLSMITFSSKAQTITNYSYAASSGTFTPLTTGDSVRSAGSGAAMLADGVLSDQINLGFNFVYMGSVYSRCRVSTDGYLTFTTTGTNVAGNALATNTTLRPTIAALWDDLDGKSGSSKFTSSTSGVPGSRVFTVEWLNWEWNWNVGSPVISFQIKLYEANGAVQFIYRSDATAAATGSASVGINGGTTSGSGTYLSLNNLSSTATASSTSETTTISAKPVTGQTYTFTPPAPPLVDPSSLTFTNIGLTSVTLNWTGASPTTGLAGYAIFTSTDGGATFTPAGNTGIANNTFTVTGLTPGTTYTFAVYATNEGGLSSSPATGFQSTNSCSISGTQSVGPGGTYANLTSAITALVNNGVSGPVVLELNSSYSSASETFPLKLRQVICGSSTNTITIRPALGASATITSPNTTGTLLIDSADNYIIDGRPGGVGTASGLTISNTSTTTGYAVQFVNDATNNIIRFATIRANAVLSTSGVVVFSTTNIGATGTGNDNNTITNCNINGNGAAFNLIYASGTTTNEGTNNSGINISNNTLQDQFAAGNTYGIQVLTGNTNWTINANSLYQTATRTFTTGYVHYAIRIGAGHGHAITNNFIGGSAANCGGTAWTIAGNVTNRWEGISLSTAVTSMTTVSGNVMTNLNFTSSSGVAAIPGIWGGIYLQAGIASITNNTIGSTSANSAIVLTTSNSGTSAGIVTGSTSTGNVTISNNTIAGIDLAGSAVSVSHSFNAIWNTANIGGLLTINANTIGSSAVANSIRYVTAGTSAAAGVITGILQAGVPTVSAQINNNIIQNLFSAYVPTTAATVSIIRGILITSGRDTVTGNIIRNLSTSANATGTGSSASVIGISNTSTTAGQLVRSNTIHSLFNNNATVSAHVYGIQINGVAATALIDRNLIYSLRSPSTIGVTAGIQIGGGTANYTNNMIRLGVDSSGTSEVFATQFNGFYEAGGTNNIWNNTVYIGGSSVNTSPATVTHAFNNYVAITSTRSIRNNIFVNARTSDATGGKHYAIRLASTTLTGLTINNNIYFANGANQGVLGGIGGATTAPSTYTDYANLAAWKAITTQDAASLSSNPCLANPTAATPDLRLTDCSGAGSPADGVGFDAGVTLDFEGQVRADFTPNDIGADAGNYGVVGADIGITTLVSPATSTSCYTATETVSVNLRNYGITTIDMSVTPIKVRVTGINGYLDSVIINTGTLAPNAIQLVTMPSTIDMTVSGSFVFNAIAEIDADVQLANNGMAPVTRSVIALNGTYQVGVGKAYATLTAAVEAYNTANCLAGPIVFELTDTLYSASETFPITLNHRTQTGPTRTLTIRPAAGVNAAIRANVASNAAIRIRAADWIILDGSNNGTTSRNLTIQNSGTTSAVVWLSSLQNVATDTGARNNVVRNVNIIGSAPATLGNYGIVSSGDASFTTASSKNNNISLINNAISRAYIGIFATASTTVANERSQNFLIQNNVIGADVPADYVTNTGISLAYVENSRIDRNTVFNMIHGNSYTSVAITLGAGSNKDTISNNTIRGIQANTTSGYGAFGIQFSTTTAVDSNLIINNMISDLITANYSATSNSFNAFGIRLAGGNNTRVYNNTINMVGSVVNGTAAGFTSNIVITTTSMSNLDLRNNILNMGVDFGVAGASTYNVHAPAGFVFGNINNNNYSGTTTTNSTYRVGNLGSNVNDLAAWKLATTRDSISTNVTPNFISSTNLRLNPLTNNLLNNTGAPLAAAAIDIDGVTRNATTPDMGIAEFEPTPGVNMGGAALASPTVSGCYTNAETVTATIRNFAYYTHDFAVDSILVIVKEPVTGYADSVMISSGTLAPNATLNVTMPSTINMSAIGTYNFSISTEYNGVDLFTSNDTISVGRARVATEIGTASVINPSGSAYCITTGRPRIQLSSYQGGAIQWQSSTDSTNWTNVGTDSIRYTTADTITVTTWYRAILSCYTAVRTSNAVKVVYNNPSISSVTGATRCGAGTVTLSATTSAGAQANWYSAATGGTPLATGATYSPTVSSSTIYYVTASEGGVSNLTLTGDGDWQHVTTAGGFQSSLITSAYAILTITQPIKLSSFDIYPSAALGTSFTIEARTGSASGTTAYTFSGATTVVNSGTPTVAQTLNLDWNLTPGTYYIGFPTTNPSTWRSGVATHSFPWTLAGFASLDFYLAPSYQYYFYNFKFGSGCEQPVRTPVNVTTSTPPSITVGATPSTICEGQSTTLSVTSSNTDYSYGWTGGLTGATQTVTPASTTTYTLTAIDSSAGTFAGCGNSSTVTVTVNPAPAAVTISDDVTICPGSTTQLTATSSKPGLVSNYGFSVSSGTLDPMTTAGTLLGVNQDDEVTTTPTPIGFTFNLNNTNYTQFSVSADGWMMLGSTTASQDFTNGVTKTTNIPKIYPMWDDLATGTDGGVTYYVDSTATGKILKVQWFVTSPRNTTGTANGKFQAWLYEGSNKIEFRYGNIAASGSASAGITAGSTNYESITYSTNSASSSLANDANAVSPAEGTMYTFTMPTSPITWSPATYLNSTSGITVVSTPLESITYTATATLGACTKTDTVRVTLNDLDVTASFVQPLCNGASNGSITATATGGFTPYTYSLNRVTYQSSNTFTLPAGTYKVYVKDARNCIDSTSSIVVTQPTPVVASVDASTNPVCNNDANGTITASATGGTGAHQFSIDGTTYQSTGSFSGLASGTYTVYAKDENNCVGTTTISLINPAKPVLVATNNSPICDSLDVTLTATSGYVTYSWSGPGSITNGTDSIATATYPVANGDVYTVTITDALGCTNTATTTLSITPRVPASVSVSVFPSLEICSGTAITFTATPTNGGASPSYQWYLNGVAIAGATSATYADSNFVDADQVYVMMTSNANCASGSPAQSNISTVTITGLIFASVDSLVATNTTVCAGTPVTYTSYITGGGSNPSYEFFVNNISVQSGVSSTYTYTPADGDQIYVTMTSSYGCAIGSPATSAPVTMTVNPIPDAPVVTITGDTVFCNGGSVTLTSSYTGGNVWTGSVSGDALVVTTSGTYSVVHTSAVGCPSPASVPVTVVVNANPVVSISGASAYCTNSSTLLTANATAGSGTITGYQWTLDGTTALGTASTQSANAVGSYTVAVTNSNGCTTTSSAFELTSNTPPTAGATAACSTLYPGQSTILTATPSSGVTYRWTLAGTQVGTSETYTTAINGTGIYQVRVTDIATGCVDSTTVTVNAASGPIAGGSTFAIPGGCGSFPTIASAMTYLNNNGVTGTGNITFNVAADYTETAPARGLVLGSNTFSATQTSATPVIFQKSGVGADPLVTAGLQPAGSQIDAIIKLRGADYITFDGIDVRENPSNTVTTLATNTMTEYGYALMYNDTTNGSQNNTIRNASITLVRTYQNSIGIYSNSRHNPDSTTTKSITDSINGTNSFNKFYANTISNVNVGFALIGDLKAGFDDRGNDIGGTSSATGNSITNWGGFANNTAAPSMTGLTAGIYLMNQVNDNASYNTITSANMTGTSVNIRGIVKNYSNTTTLNTNTVFNNNTITLRSGFTSGTFEHITAGQSTAVNLDSSSTMTISNNLIENSVISGTATSTAFMGINASLRVGTVNINNNTIRGVTTTASTGGFTGIQQTVAVGRNINITNNNIGDATAGAVTYSATNSGTFNGISVSAAPSTGNLVVRDNNIRGVVYSTTAVSSAAQNYYTLQATARNLTLSNNSITNLAVNTTGTVEMFYSTCTTPVGGIKNIDSNRVVGGFNRVNAKSGATYIIDNAGSSATGAILNIRNNDLQNIMNGARNGGLVYGIFDADGSSSGATRTITNNIVRNMGNDSSSTVYGMYHSYFGGNSVVSNNTVDNIQGRTTTYGIYLLSTFAGSPVLEVSNNVINNVNSRLTGGTTYGLWVSNASPIVNVTNNTISNVSTLGTTSTVAGLYLSSSGNTVNARGNTIFNVAGLNTGSQTVYGLWMTGALTMTSDSNTIYNVSALGTTAPVIRGVNIAGGTTMNLTRNRIYDIRALRAATGSSLVNGVQIGGGTTVNVNNNMIANLFADSSSNADAIRGINITSTGTSTNMNIHYNTVLLNATSTGTNFGTSAMYHTVNTTATTAALTMNNNIFVNKSQAKGTGNAIAYRRSGNATGALTNYVSTSNNNLFFAGTPGAKNLLYFSGSTAADSISTLAAMKTALAPREAASISEDPAFLSTVGSNANFLRIDPTVATQIEGGGVNISGITTDIDGQIRQGNTGYTGSSTSGTDLGADEYEGTPPPCTGSNAGTAIVNRRSVCTGNSAGNFTHSGVSTGGGITYAWKVATSLAGPFDAVVGGIGSNTPSYSTPANLTAGTYYYVLEVTCTSSATTTVSAVDTLIVNQTPTVTASNGGAVCSGSNLTLAGTTTAGTTYLWTGPAGYTSTKLNDTIVAPINGSGKYFFNATNNGCTGRDSTVVTINATPGVFAASPAIATICGNDSIAISLGSSGSGSIGTGTLTNTTTTPYKGFWGANKSQFLYTAAEISAMGMTGGNLFSSITLPITSYTGPYTFNGFVIRMKNTTATSLTSTFESGTTTVFGPTNYTLSGSGAFDVTHTFDAPFLWDGSSNVIVEFCFNNNDGGGVSANSASVRSTSVTGGASYASNDATANACDVTAATTTTTRINATFGYSSKPNFPVTWSPSTGLTLAPDGFSAMASPGSSTVYTITSTNGSCSRSNTLSITQNPQPANVTMTGNNTVCQNSTAPQVTFTAGIGTGPYTFSYKINNGATLTATTPAGPNPRSVSVNVPTGTPGTFTYKLIGVADIYCSSVITDSVSITVNALPTVSFTGFSGSSYCLSESTTLTSNQAAGTFSGAGITSNGDGTANWSAATAGAGTHTITYSFTDANGCTNTSTQSVTVNPNVSAGSLANASTCVGTSVQVVRTGGISGGVFSSSDPSVALVNPTSGVVSGASGGTAIITYTIGAGCGSPVSSSATVTVNTATSSTIEETACNSFTYNGVTYTTSGTYNRVLVNANGCDSLVTLNLTINSSSTSSTPITACDSYVWNGTTYTTSGVKTFTTTNAAGCDSVASLILTINNSTTSTTPASACNSFTWNGTTYTTSGTYTWSGTNAAGCDSTATLNLTIRTSTSASVSESACNSYNFNGTTYTVGGEYIWTGTNAAGCDSVVTLTLTINSPSSSSDTVSACTSYTWNGTTYTTSGNYTFNTTNANGCDSVANLALTINTCNTTLNLNAFIEGFYSGSSTMVSSLFDQGISTDATATDTITVNLHASSPSVSSTPTYSAKVILHNNGTATAIFPGATLGNSYYIALKHRNHMETWSAAPVTFSATNSYDFTSSVSSAYSDGVNAPMKSVSGGKFAMYAGDVNQDGTIDLFDLLDTENDASNFTSGYNASDVNGDATSDLFDLILIENNSTLFIFVAQP